MPEPKNQIVSSIVKARAELEDALFELEKMPAISQSSVFFAAHALNNFLTVTGGTLELLASALANHPDPQVHIWLDALQQATNLMTHTVSQLMNSSTDRDPKLRVERWICPSWRNASACIMTALRVGNRFSVAPDPMSMFPRCGRIG